MVQANEIEYEVLEESVRKVDGKGNIFVCGASQVGKSSLINDILDLSEENQAAVGEEGESQTRGIHRYETETLNVYDSEGYEIGEEKQKHFEENILSFLKTQNNAPNETEHIHEMWYCISAPDKKVLDIDKKIIEEARKWGVPVCVILTKIDEVSGDVLNELKQTIHDCFPDIAVFTYSVKMYPEVVGMEMYKQYVQNDEIIHWAKKNMSEELKESLLRGLRVTRGMKDKKKQVNTIIVPEHAALAAAAVVANNAFNPVPLSDSVPLISIQTKMTMDIFQTYGIDGNNLLSLVKALSGTTALSYLGKTAATQIIGLLPGIGNATKVVVNTTIAASITATLGLAVSFVVEKYIKECVDTNGETTTPFGEYFTSKRLKDAMKFIEDHKEDLDLSKIVEQAVKKGEKEA